MITSEVTPITVPCSSGVYKSCSPSIVVVAPSGAVPTIGTSTSINVSDCIPIDTPESGL